jgi:hypothetical protein
MIASAGALPAAKENPGVIGVGQMRDKIPGNKSEPPQWRQHNLSLASRQSSRSQAREAKACAAA